MPLRAQTEPPLGEGAALYPLQRVPLASLAFPTLRRYPRAQFHAFMDTRRVLVDADGRVTLSAYCIAC